jgi:saccharopine dehydrogenase (NADP+, L-glutamate forming)
MIFEAMDWLRLFDESVKTTPGSTHVENLVAVMQGRLVYQPGETDLVVMQHIFKVQYPNKPHIKTIKSTLVMTGDKNGKYTLSFIPKDRHG